MEDALMFAASAPLITLVVSVVRRIVPALDGVWVPRLVVALTVAWGLVLVYSGRFAGDLPEFVIACAAVSAAAIGVNRLDKLTQPGNPPIR